MQRLAVPFRLHPLSSAPTRLDHGPQREGLCLQAFFRARSVVGHDLRTHVRRQRLLAWNVGSCGRRVGVCVPVARHFPKQDAEAGRRYQRHSRGACGIHALRLVDIGTFRYECQGC